ncbi:hypothetical protein GCM10023094_31780 [Rhodococcus olei]|uniref:Uncharacterized protein n=1 Tax=Rhodococcus olei TaxID=2161675 RepID=A0ABP8P7V8_9NOCA
MGSSDDDIKLIKQVQPIVTGLGTIIGGVGAVLTVGAALASFS